MRGPDLKKPDIYLGDQTALRKQHPYLKCLTAEEVRRLYTQQLKWEAEAWEFSEEEGIRLLFTAWRIRTRLKEPRVNMRVIMASDNS